METPELHPSITGVLRFFEFDHLPPYLQAVSEPFWALAHGLVENPAIEHGAELTVALRKLLESKDCAVRSALPQ